MKALLTNLAKSATLSSLYESLSYPASNVVDTFLDKPFVSTLITDTLTVDFGADTVFDCIFVAGCNAESLAIVAQNNALTTVYSGTKEIDADTVSLYPGTLTARYVTFTGTASGSSYLKIKGIGIGVAVDFGNVTSRMALVTENGSSRSRSVTGQVIGNRAPVLSSREISVPVTSQTGGRTRVLALLSELSTLGTGKPAYWDIASQASEFEVPLYAEIPSAWTADDNGTYYAIKFSILEAR